MADIANPDTRKPASSPTREYEEYIARALATQGGHLCIGRGGAALYFERGWLSGCHEERIKAEAIAAGLPVIDSRSVSFDLVWDLAVRGPMVAVGEPPSPPPSTRSPTHRSRWCWRRIVRPAPRCSTSRPFRNRKRKRAEGAS